MYTNVLERALNNSFNGDRNVPVIRRAAKLYFFVLVHFL